MQKGLDFPSRDATCNNTQGQQRLRPFLLRNTRCEAPPRVVSGWLRCLSLAAPQGGAMKTTLALGWVEIVLGTAWAVSAALQILSGHSTLGGVLVSFGLGLSVVALGIGTTIGGRASPT